MVYNFPTDVPANLLDNANGGRSRVIKMPAHQDNLGGYGYPNTPRALVLHTPEEDADGIEVTPKWFRDPRAKASTHYYADNDGDLIQMVAEIDCAWAQGTSGFNRTWKGEFGAWPPWNNEGMTNNARALSIEIEGRAATIGQTITPEQFETVARWIAYACHKYNIPVDDDHVVRHSDLATDRSDPGTLPQAALIERARVLLGLDVEGEEVVESTVEVFTEEDIQARLRLAYVRGFDLAKSRTMAGARVWLDEVDDNLMLRAEDVDDGVVDLMP